MSFSVVSFSLDSAASGLLRYAKYAVSSSGEVGRASADVEASSSSSSASLIKEELSISGIDECAASSPTSNSTVAFRKSVGVVSIRETAELTSR